MVIKFKRINSGVITSFKIQCVNIEEIHKKLIQANFITPESPATIEGITLELLFNQIDFIHWIISVR